MAPTQDAVRASRVRSPREPPLTATSSVPGPRAPRPSTCCRDVPDPRTRGTRAASRFRFTSRSIEFREYGTPGIARAQQLAALALGDTTRQHLAETAFTSCVTDPAQIRRLTDRSLCHGTAGLLAVGRRIAADALTPTPVAPLIRLHQRATRISSEPAGFLDGAAGAALGTTTTTSWDDCLLLI